MLKVVKISAILFGAICMVLVFVFGFNFLFRIGYREAGVSSFQKVGLAVAQYRVDNKGHLPSSLADITNSGFDVLPILRNMTDGRLANGDVLEQFNYIDWERVAPGMNVPGDYPLLYNKFILVNGGIFVLTVDGHAFWDRGAQKTNAFVSEHSQYDLKPAVSFPSRETE